MSLSRKLKVWSDNQLISEVQAQSILTFESNRGRSRIFFGLGGLGVLSILLGFGSLIAANWFRIPPELRIGGHIVLNIALAIATIPHLEKPTWVREVLISLQAGLIMTFIALIGQTLQTQAPLWQPLGLWLLLATPMLISYGRWFGIVCVWLGVVAVFTGSFGLNVLGWKASQVVFSAVPYILFAAFSLRKTRETISNWSFVVQRVFWVLLVMGTTQSQVVWGLPTGRSADIIPSASVITAGVGTLGVYLLNVLQRFGMISFWYDETREWNAVLVVSYLFAALPLIVPHSGLAVIGTLMFSAYWFFMGGMGLRLGIGKLWSLSIVLIGIRLFIAYFEVMGTLAMQGFGFLFSGFVLLGLAYVARKIVENPPAWLLAGNNGGSL